MKKNKKNSLATKLKVRRIFSGRFPLSEKPQDKDYLPSPKPASEKAKLERSSLKDKGMAATEQPINKFDRVRMVPFGPSHVKLNKGYLSGPKSAKRLEILLPDTAAHKSKSGEPAWENFSKSFYRLLNKENILWSKEIASLQKELRDPRRMETKIGDRKYFPAVSTE